MGSALVRHESCHFGKQIQMLISDCYSRIGRKTVAAGVLIFLLITLSVSVKIFWHRFIEKVFKIV